MDKKVAQLVSAIFIALIFMSSILYRIGSPSTEKQTSTTTIIPTVYVTGYAEANVVGYAPVFLISISCNSSGNVSGYLNGKLNSLEANHSVTNFYSASSNSFSVQSGNESSYDLYLALYSGLGEAAACTSFSSGAMIELPSSINVDVPSQGAKAVLSLPYSKRGYTIPITLSMNASSSMNVSVAAVITQNGMLFGNMSISRVG